MKVCDLIMKWGNVENHKFELKKIRLITRLEAEKSGFFPHL